MDQPAGTPTRNDAEIRQMFSAALNAALEARRIGEWEQILVALEEPLLALGSQPHPNRKMAVSLLDQARTEIQRQLDFNAKVKEAKQFFEEKEFQRAMTAFDAARAIWPDAPQIAQVNEGYERARLSEHFRSNTQAAKIAEDDRRRELAALKAETERQTLEAQAAAVPRPAPPPLTRPGKAPARPLRRYFIADAHLDGTESTHALKLRVFLKRLVTEVDTSAVELYVLGDLFKFWNGDDPALFEKYRADLLALEMAARGGVKIVLIDGNHDFFYGPEMAARLGIERAGAGRKITLNDGRAVWVEHGDLLCPADRKYQFFQRRLRGRIGRWINRFFPEHWAQSIVESVARMANSDRRFNSTATIDPFSARHRMDQTRSKLLMCGHAQQAPAKSLVELGYSVIVLPAWCDAMAGYTDDGQVLKPFRA